MRATARRGGWVMAAALLCVEVAAQQQERPTFRGRVVLVPVDVRVVGRDGNPVRDLTREDFSIRENGVRQELAHFSTHDHTEVGAAADAEPSFSRTANFDTTPATHRTFVIVLGRGRLQGPAKGLDAAIDFIRNRTLPHDRVGVVAYDRMTELTTDRESVVRFLEHYKREYEWVEALMTHWFQGLTAAYGGPDPSPGIQAKIDKLFDAPGLPRFRHLIDVMIPGEGELEEARREFGRALGTIDEDDAPRGFVYNAAARQDLEKLHAVLSYLRYLEGEKHLLFLTTEGHSIFGGFQLGEMAADARVTLSSIHTGGLQTSWRGPMFMGPSWGQRWANQTSRDLAKLTGGVASTYEYAARTIDKLERATRFHYLLGYYPTNAKWNGDKRNIEVTVNRPRVRVLYRHSYFAQQDPPTFDRREFLSNSRISGAANYRRLVDDVRVKVSADRSKTSAGIAHVEAEVTIDASTIAFSEEEGQHVALLDIAVFAGTRNERVIGESRRRLDLKLNSSDYAQLQKDGIVVKATIETKGQARQVKAVVYDYAADRLGSAVTQMR